MKLQILSMILSMAMAAGAYAARLTHHDLDQKIQALQEELNQARSEWKSAAAKSASNPKPSVTVMGRIMVDYSFLSADAALSTASGTNAKNGAEFRRARLGAKGKYKNVEYQIEYDFAGGGASLKASYLRWRNRNNKALWISHIKEPFGLEFNSSSKYPTFIENSLLAAFYPGYNTGIYLTEDSGEHRFSYSLGLFHDSDSFGKSSPSDEDDLNLTARVTYLLKNEGKGRKLLHVGIAYTSRNGDSFRYRTRAENHFWDQRFVDTGANGIAAEGATQTGLELVWHNGPLQVQAEHIMAEVDANSSVTNPTGVDPEFSGTYVQASYFLTGEHRAYNDKFRLFSRVIPKEDYGTNGGRGAWQVALRYSTIDLNDAPAGIMGGQQSSTTLGVNWHLNSHSRVMLNQTYSELEGVGDSESTTLRFQIDF